MPNWVDNKITIETNNPLLIDLLLKINNSYSDDVMPVFEVLRPIGEYDNERACENWGCKWDICNYLDINGEYGDNSYTLEILGQTPWSFPDNLLSYLIDTFAKDDYFVRVRCVWLEEGGEWGEWENGDWVASGMLSKKDLISDTYASCLLQPIFDIACQWEWLLDEDE